MAFNLTANLNVAVNTGALKAAANQINSTLGSVNNLKIGTNSATFASIRPLKAQIVESTDAIENFGKQAGLAAKRFAAFSVTAGAIIGFVQTIKNAVGTAIDFDREMIRLSQVSNDSAQDVANVGQEITRLSTGLGVSSQDLVKVAVTLKQANLSLKDTKIALEAMAQAALAPNFDNLKDTTEGAIAIMNQFKISATGLSGALGSVNVVAGEFAVEAGDIIEAVRKTGGAFKSAGGNLNELIALFTAVRQTTRESAESIGTGLRTIFTRIQRNDTAAALKEVGINLRYTRDEAIALGDAGLEQQFVGPYEAVKRLSEGLNTLRSTDPRFSAIVEQLGGYRQISKVIPLIQEFGTAQKALGIAQAGSVSLALNAGQAQDALAVKLQKLKETFLDVGRNIVNSPGFRNLVDVFITGSTAALRLLDSLKGLIPVLAAIAAVKIGQGLVSFGTGFVKGASSKKADGGFIRMQKGGIVPGSGSGDKVPALLEPGEMVIPKKYVGGGSIYRQRFMEGNEARSKPFPKGLYPEEILGFTKGYIPQGPELTSAFRRAALIHHSDRGGLPENMAQVNAAFQRLKDRSDLKKARSQSGPKTANSPPPPPKNNAQSEDQMFRSILAMLQLKPKQEVNGKAQIQKYSLNQIDLIVLKQLEMLVNLEKKKKQLKQ